MNSSFRKKTGSHFWFLLGLCCAMTRGLAAQEAPSHAGLGDVRPPPTNPWKFAGVAAPPEATSTGCYPACRRGYLCAPKGRCISACNPECAAGETCVSAGVCKSKRDLAARVGRKHDGLLARFSVGLQTADLRVSSGVAAVGVQHDSGIGLSTAVDLGVAVIENLIVRGRGKAGMSSGGSDSSFGTDAFYDFVALGLGADYYFMPINIRTGLTVSVTGIELEHLDEPNRSAIHSKAGFGLELDLAKEWWLGAEWALGVGATLSFMSVAPANIAPHSDGRLTGWFLSPHFFAAFN